MKMIVLKRAWLKRAVRSRPTIVISDLHENSAGPQDNCQGDLLCAFLLRFAPREYDLIIAGDRYDRQEEPNGAAIYAHNERLERIIARFFTLDLPGNHDDVPGACYTELDFHELGLFIWHGNQLDPACRGRGTLGRIAARAWGGLERLGLGRPLAGVKRAVVRAADRRIQTASKRNDGNDVYLADAMRRDLDLYIFGHTHRPELIEWGDGRILANCGCWTNKGRGCAVLVNGLEVILLEVTE